MARHWRSTQQTLVGHAVPALYVRCTRIPMRCDLRRSSRNLPGVRSTRPLQMGDAGSFCDGSQRINSHEPVARGGTLQPRYASLARASRQNRAAARRTVVSTCPPAALPEMWSTPERRTNCYPSVRVRIVLFSEP
jgi:hypothetical protein